MSAHALKEEDESGAYISREVAIGDGPLVGICEDGSGLGGGKLLSCDFFFLLFFFFFLGCCCCCCCEELKVSIVECCIKMGISGLNGCGLLDEESLVVVDMLESLIPDLKRFNP